MKKLIVNLMATYLPDQCGLGMFFGKPICQFNPYYNDVIEEKLRRKGYGSDKEEL